ncbi:uncharacterized protein SCHCODRAFT_02508058 [Schizophyllum commune H4-8]|nr:uncharacterized protein SCHCODRAFT_02508058 [Schizophyllum commune H4-8]KAI5889972.1 hypothetical protein SCHCODRAFT_02508058 [Schizophyllum commune H4-8]
MTSQDDRRPSLKRRADDDLPGPSIKRPRSQSPPTRAPPPSGHGRGCRGKAPASVLRRSPESPPLPGPSHGTLWHSTMVRVPTGNAEPHGSRGANAHYIDPHVMPMDYHKPLYPSTGHAYASADYGALASFYPPPPFAGPGSGTLDAVVASFEAALMGGCYPPVPGGYPAAPTGCSAAPGGYPAAIGGYPAAPPAPGLLPPAPFAYPALAPGYSIAAGYAPPPPSAPAPFPVFYPPYPIYAYPPPPAARQPHAPAFQPPQPAPAQDHTPQYYDAFAATPTPTERLDAEAWRDAYPGEYPAIPPVYPIRVSSPPARLPELMPDAVRVVGEDGVSRDESCAGRGESCALRGESCAPRDEPCARSRTSSPDPFAPLTPAEVVQHTLRAREEAAPWYECISRWRETVRGGEGEDPRARYLPRTCVDYARKSPARCLSRTPARYAKDPRAGYPKDQHAKDFRMTRLPTPQPPYMGPFNPPYDVDEGACRLPAARVPFSKDPKMRDWRRPVGAGEGMGVGEGVGEGAGEGMGVGVGVGDGMGASEPISVDPPVSVDPPEGELGEERFGEGGLGERSGEGQLGERSGEGELGERFGERELRERSGEREPHEEAGVTRLIDGMAGAFAAQLDRVADELIGGHAAHGQFVEGRKEEPLVPRSYAQQLEREVAQLEKNVAELETDAAQFRTVLAAAEHDVADLGEELLFARRLAAGARAALAGCRYQLKRMRMQFEDAEGERGAAV